MIDTAAIDAWLIAIWKIVSSDAGKFFTGLLTLTALGTLIKETSEIKRLDFKGVDGGLNTPEIEFRRRRGRTVSVGRILAAVALIGPGLYIVLAYQHPAANPFSVPLGWNRMALAALFIMAAGAIPLYVYFYSQVAALKKASAK